MQKYRYQNSYMRGVKRNVVNNMIAGIIMAGTIFIMQLPGSCEQPEITHLKTVTDSIQINKNDGIKDWDTDITIYHTTTKPK